MSDFNDTSNIAWYPAAYSLTTCALIPLAGKLSSLLPLRWVYQTFFTIFLLGSAVCGAANAPNTFIAGRALAGVGAAGVASGGLNVVLAVSGPATRALNMGLVSCMFALGIVLAPVVGGALTQHVGWRWCFFVNLPAGAVTVVAMFFFFRPGRRAVSEEGERSVCERLKHLDLAGCVLFVPACFMVLMALQWGGVKYPWRSATVVGLFVGGGVLVAVFVGWQRFMGEYALIPGSVVRRRAVAVACVFAFCQMGGLAVMSYYLPEWFQAVQGVSPLDSGVRVLPSVVSQIVGILVVGALGEYLVALVIWVSGADLLRSSDPISVLQPLAVYRIGTHVHRRGPVHDLCGIRHTISRVDRLPGVAGSRGRVDDASTNFSPSTGARGLATASRWRLARLVCPIPRRHRQPGRCRQHLQHVSRPRSQ